MEGRPFSGCHFLGSGFFGFWVVYTQKVNMILRWKLLLQYSVNVTSFKHLNTSRQVVPPDAIFWVLDFWVLGSGKYFEFPRTPFLAREFPRTLANFTEPKKSQRVCASAVVLCRSCIQRVCASAEHNTTTVRWLIFLSSIFFTFLPRTSITF
jgi:hypothetical protein